MKKELYRKNLIFGIVLLLIGASVVSSIAGNFDEKTIFVAGNKVEFSSNNFGSELYYPTDDTKIRMKSPDNNYGTYDVMDVRNRYGYSGHPDYWEHDVLIKFDISNIPIGSNIISAELFLYYSDWYDNNPVGRDLTLYKITSDWNENTVTWNTRPIITDNYTSFSIVPTSYSWMIWDVTEDVKDFVNEVETNYGWQIMDENYWGTFDIPTTQFKTKEYGDLIPYLQIEINDNIPPTAYFTFRPLNPTVKDIIMFKSVSPDMDGSIVSWWWNFGNGYYSDLGNPNFQYYKEGIYTVSLTVTDNFGLTDTFEREIIVT